MAPIQRSRIASTTALVALALASGSTLAASAYPMPPGPPVLALDLSNTAVTSGMVNGAIFAVDSTQPAGTGVFNPFLRLQVTGSGNQTLSDEQGYNTQYFKPNVLDNKNPLNWTHRVAFADLVVEKIGGIDYYKFKLDINEPQSTPDNLLSLDGLKLFSTTDAGSFQNGEAVDAKTGDWLHDTSTTTLLWSLDTLPLSNGNNNNGNDRYVLLDSSRSSGGSGIADMVAYLPVSSRPVDQDYMILWSRFGITYAADPVAGVDAEGGFEEWSYQSKSNNPNDPGGGGGPGVPEPTTAALMLAGVFGAIASRRRRTR